MALISGSNQSSYGLPQTSRTSEQQAADNTKKCDSVFMFLLGSKILSCRNSSGFSQYLGSLLIAHTLASRRPEQHNHWVTRKM
uniref:Putative ovule protein n=1 Tax=Solanum chacoense TaxID=4108 RepID=A0A0V0GNQ3_SOLCH